MTETELLNWSKLSTSTCGVDVWLRMMLPDEIDNIKRLHCAICKWRDVAEAEFEEFKSKCERNPNPAWDELLRKNLKVNDPNQA